ncbi:HEXXH motif-containing putative peptide modification protein [Vibrio sp. AND4]|uniref:aKG-HExxH-type peptide beta-hydroxylase n=1 Tax=Vibrio sp. AND4 TaxID=314289 RepID=UPI00015F0DFC|nr:HEXXH motif-containing putative peptide modification protein [Vibrio sp. AND4]EDP57875.1 hypothetical protein AND4_12277 [Vibrio sp. AND4]
MIFLSLSHANENIEKLSKAVLKEQFDASRPIKEMYAKAVSTIRGMECSANISVQFHDTQIAKEAIRQGVFSEAADIDEKISLQSKEYRDHCLSLYEEALALINEKSTDLYNLVQAVTTDVVFVYSPRIGGGTGSHLPGVICISIGDDWTAMDVANTLIHEATHLNVFICDMVNKIFSKPASELDKDEYRVLSAVRVGDMRPLDKAIHSAFVTVPLLYFESLVGKDDMMQEFTNSLDDCVNGVVDKIDTFTPYGKQLVEDLDHFNRQRDFSLVEKSFA